MSFGLLGEKLTHSYSPVIHKMIGAYDYDLFEVEPADLEDFILNGQYNGLNVTVPYKENVMPFIKVDPLARQLGAVNTIYLKNGELRGTNTDYFGFMYLLSLAQIDLSNKKVLVLGTGGASKIVQAIARACEAKKIFVASRQKSKEYVSYNALPVDVDIVINATPVGMYPNTSDKIIDLKKFNNLEAVIDLIYNPSKTDLLLQAEKKGVKAVNGLAMLVAQATKSAQHFIGMDFLQYNKPILTNLLALTLNITLVGMPGSGKTAIGDMIAKLTGRKFIDIDDEIVKKAGMSIPEIFETHGEEYFRDMESEILKEYCKETSLVIATGGGSVLREENRDAMRSNSMVVELTRDFSLLEKDGRPLSESASSMEEMYEARKECYNLAKDLTVANDDTVEAIANKILDEIGEYYEKSNRNN